MGPDHKLFVPHELGSSKLVELEAFLYAPYISQAPLGPSCSIYFVQAHSMLL